MDTSTYGKGDASFQAAGQEAGIRKLVQDFYRIMDERDYSQSIRSMHPDDIAISEDKLATFLSGWMGGPRLYTQKYGPISIPGVHAHLSLDESHREAWLDCMAEALELQDYEPAFVVYLKAQFRVPAERILQASQMSEAS